MPTGKTMFVNTNVPYWTFSEPSGLLRLRFTCLMTRQRVGAVWLAHVSLSIFPEESIDLFWITHESLERL